MVTNGYILLLGRDLFFTLRKAHRVFPNLEAESQDSLRVVWKEIIGFLILISHVVLLRAVAFRYCD